MAYRVWLCTPSVPEAEAIRRIWPTGSCPILITGVGAVATTEALWHHLYAEGPPEVIIVLGLAGAYDRSLPLYAGVQVRKDVWAAFGRRRVRSLEPLPQSLLRDFPLVVESLAPMLAMPQVIGLTLESVSACRKEAAFWRRAYPNAALETQENAAYLRFGARLGLPVYALRVISNWVGDRRWDRLAAFEALANFAYHVGFPLYERLLAGETAPGSGH